MPRKRKGLISDWGEVCLMKRVPLYMSEKVFILLFYLFSLFLFIFLEWKAPTNIPGKTGEKGRMGKNGLSKLWRLIFSLLTCRPRILASKWLLKARRGLEHNTFFTHPLTFSLFLPGGYIYCAYVWLIFIVCPWNSVSLPCQAGNCVHPFVWNTIKSDSEHMLIDVTVGFAITTSTGHIVCPHLITQ